MTRRAAGIALVVLGLAACGRSRVRVQPAPEQLLEQAQRAFRGGDFRRALLDYQRLQFELAVGDPQQAEVGYYLAECQFQLGQRLEAATQFRNVADQLPQSPYAPLALLRAGDAHLRLWRRPELDPTNGQTALALYQELVGRYPESDAAARAQLHVARLREWFADKTYKNGMFYLRRRAYDSAILYFKDVIANFANTRRAPDALLRLLDAYRAIGYQEELKETCDHLRRYYPDTDGLDEQCPAAEAAAARP